MNKLKVFLSYHFPDQEFVARVHFHLTKQPGLQSYFFGEDARLNGWRALVGEQLDESLMFLLFLGRKVGQTQRKEAAAFAEQCQGQRAPLRGRRRRPPESVWELERRAVVVTQSADRHWGVEGLLDYVNCHRVHIREFTPETAERCAKDLANHLAKRWIASDGLPAGYPFGYEKDIIDTYAGRDRKKYMQMLRDGCPAEWPQEEEVAWDGYKNPISEEVIGSFREKEERILVDARSRYHHPDPDGDRPASCCLVRGGLTFGEAGPRRMLKYPPPSKRLLKVGILVSGGIAPGINAVISGIVQRHILYCDPSPADLGIPARDLRRYKLQVFGFRNGLAGLLAGDDVSILYDGNRRQDYFREIANWGGSEIGTSRCDELLSSADAQKREEALSKVVNNLDTNHFDILYVIGGDGSMRAAHAIWTRAREMHKSISVVGVPKTMDNDILWVWQAFGFLSAVERAKEAIRQLHAEVRSNPRLCIVQLFGSDSGFVVSHAALASGVCDAVLIPEVPFSMRRLAQYVRRKLTERYSPGWGGQSPYGMIVMAETAIPQDVGTYLDDPKMRRMIRLEDKEKAEIDKFIAQGWRVFGQTPDALRTGGLKIVSRVLQHEIRTMRKDDPYWETFRVFTNEPRHLLRAIPPSASDVIFGQRLGVLAVDNAMAGYTNFMISQWLTEYVLVPLKLVVLGRKRVPRTGIFWKSVLANTGQPADLEQNGD
jgi:6-phosphofructokinase 1